jgi:hypothetical protein
MIIRYFLSVKHALTMFVGIHRVRGIVQDIFYPEL